MLIYTSCFQEEEKKKEEILMQNQEASVRNTGRFNRLLKGLPFGKKKQQKKEELTESDQEQVSETSRSAMREPWNYPAIEYL